MQLATIISYVNLLSVRRLWAPAEFSYGGDHGYAEACFEGLPVAYLRAGLAGHGPCQTFKVPALWTSPSPLNLNVRLSVIVVRLPIYFMVVRFP